MQVSFVYDRAYDIILSCPAIKARVNPDIIINSMRKKKKRLFAPGSMVSHSPFLHKIYTHP